MSAVGKVFGTVKALDEISLRVAPQSIMGLIGPNGSGKTTLLNVVSGVMRPSSGAVAIEGRQSPYWPAHKVARRGVGRTFQQIRLFNEMTVAENVEVGAVARGWKLDGEALGTLLGQLNLDGDADRLAGTLSYGQQRRVEIARALAGRPRLLLLDEPAAGMNEEESDALLETVRAAREALGCTVLIVDHDLRLIMRLCDRIHVLAEGTTIFEGTPEDVRHDSEVVAAYLGTAADTDNHPEGKR